MPFSSFRSCLKHQRWLLTSLLLGNLPNSGWAQSPAPLPAALLNRDLISKSPTAAGLGRFGSVPVSLYTGVPSIEIPLYTLAGRSLSVPLKLQYHGGGIKLDDVASWTGLGWSLNAGGVVTHALRGTDDLAPGGYILANAALGTPPVPLTVDVNCGTARPAGTPDYYSYCQQIYSGQLDSQPDAFSFNFLQYSGKIVFSQDGQYTLSPAQPLLVECPTSTRRQWKFTDERGTQYIFRLSDAEYTNGYPQGALTGYTPSAWYLSTIRALDGDSISFQYKTYTSLIEYPLITETQTLLHSWVNDNGGDHSPSSHCAPCERLMAGSFRNGTQTLQGKLLRRIVAGTTQVDLYSATGRLDYPDMPGHPGQYKLDSLVLTSSLEATPRRVTRLGFGSYGPTQRLLLTSVQEQGRSSQGTWTTSPAYQLTYDRSMENGPGPTAPGSFATDRWGFYNGVAGSNHAGFASFPGDVNLGYQPGADRETNPAYVGFGALQRITYPTGGTTDFTFEAHDFGNILPADNHREQPEAFAICTANPDPATGQPTCGSLPSTQDFVIDHAEPIAFTCELFEPNPPAPPSGGGTGLDDEGQQDISVTVWAEGLNGTATIALPFTNNKDRIRTVARSFPPGQYRLHVQLAASTTRFVQAQVTGEHRKYLPNTLYSRLGGGTRIKRIVTFDGFDHQRDQVREYYYTDSTGTASSGQLLHQPVFNQWLQYYNRNLTGVPNPEGECVSPRTGVYLCKYLMRSTQDLMAATGTVAGSEVGYSRVTVIDRGNGEAHKTVSTFTNFAPSPVYLSDNFIYNQGTTGSLDNESNGLLLRSESYAVAPATNPLQWSGCRLVKAVHQDYGSFRRRILLGLSLGWSLGNFTIDDREGPSFGRGCQGVNAYSYRVYTGWYPLVSSRETLVDAQGRVFTTATRLEYDTLTHFQPLLREVLVSGGDRQQQRYKYAPDYARTVTNVALLQDRHYIGASLEEQQWRATAAQPTAWQWLSGKATAYAQLTGGGIAATQIQVAQLTSPTALTEARDLDRHYTSWLPSPYYEPRARFRYQPNGQLIDQHLVGATASALLWGYQDTHLLTEATNASYAQVACTSFEPGATGRWQYDSTGTHRQLGGRTGRWAYQLDGTGGVTRDRLPAGDYELTYWVQTSVGVPVVTVSGGSQVGGGPQLVATVPANWRQYRVRLRLSSGAQVSLTGSAGLLDEVRLGPLGAQLTSYTYDAWGSLTSQTGPDGRTTFYEYDGLNRLVRTRDEQGRILGQQQYHYVGQR